MKVILMKTIKPDKYNTCLPTYYTVLLTLISSSPILFPSLKVKSKWCWFYFYFQRENSYLFIKNVYLYHARTWAQLCSWDFLLPIIYVTKMHGSRLNIISSHVSQRSGLRPIWRYVYFTIVIRPSDLHLYLPRETYLENAVV